MTAKAAWILLGAVWFVLYWPLLVGNVPAFRDAYHFYYPLEIWLNHQAQRGDIFPQFNPFDGIGTNLVGETSTGLFYPGRIVWWLPGLSVAQRMGCVMLLHTALAGFGAGYAAKRMQLGAAPQLLAASAYSLAGPVFFQHVNPIYLISSAWLPWVVAECWMMTQACVTNSCPRARVRWSVWITACCLMLLGGDPQCTLHCGLISVIAVATAAWSTRSPAATFRLSWQLSLAVLAVTGITAIQWLPTWFWLQATSSAPELSTASIANEQVPTLLRAFESTNYDVARGSPFAYSIAPWHFVSLLWSNSLGHVMPTNARYLSAWSAEPRMWTTSLSIGLMSLLLAISCWWHRETRRTTVYLWLVAFFSGTAMLGNYAPAWMLRSGLRWMGLETAWLPGDEVGGTYWLLVQIVPGYDAFRYPAKWSPIFAISLTLCAAHGLAQWEQVKHVFSRVLRLAIVFTILVSLSLFGLSFLSNIRDVFQGWLSHAQPDAWLGPLDANASFRHTVFSLMMACILLLAAILVQQRMRLRWQPWCLVLLVVVEMSWYDRQWLVTAQAPPARTSVSIADGAHLTRFWAGVGRANIARDVGERPDMADKLQFQQQLGLAKLHLLDTDSANLSAFMSLTPQALARVRHQLAQHDSLDDDNPALDAALAWLGVQRRLVRSDGLYWKNVSNAARLIELSHAVPGTDTLHIKYFEPSRIGLQVQNTSAAQLVVRLFQDGGWRAELKGQDRSLVAVPRSSHLGLFQTLDIPPGRWDIELRYQAPGLVAGAWVSGIALVLWILSLCITWQSLTAPQPQGASRG